MITPDVYFSKNIRNNLRFNKKKHLKLIEVFTRLGRAK